MSEREKSGEHSGSRIVTPEGVEKDYRPRRVITFQFNGSFFKHTFSFTTEIAKVLAALGIIGASMVWVFSEKVKAVVRDIVREEHAPIMAFISAHDARYYTRDETELIVAKVMERISKIEQDQTKLEQRVDRVETGQRANRRDLERLPDNDR